MRTPVPLRVALAAAALLLAPNSGLADVDVGAGNGDKARGTLLPAAEVETYRLRIPGGALLSVVAKGKKNKQRDGLPVVTFQVLDGSDADISAGRVVSTSKGAKLKKLVIPETGVYRVVLSGTDAVSGDYEIKFKWKSSRKSSADGTFVMPTSQHTFTVDAGAQATFDVKAVKGSSAQPRIVSVALVGGGEEQTPAAPRPGSRRHKVKKLPLAATAQYVVEFADDSGLGGAYICKVKLKAPKPTKQKLDVTVDAIGVGNGGDLAQGELIGAAGGSILISPQISPVVSGAGLVVPAGALALPTALLIGEAPAIPPPTEQSEGAGPTVFFGPAGQEFAMDVTITIPFDPAGFDDEFTGLVVIERDADGNTREVPFETLDIDPVAGTISFPASHFTSFRAFAPVREEQSVPGDVTGDGTADLLVRSANAAGQDGRVFVFAGGADLGDATSTLERTVPTRSGQTGTGYGATAFTADLTGGATEDLIVTGLVTTGEDPGEVYVHFGDGSLSETPDLTISAASGLISFAHGVAVGDFDDDGTPDIAIGAESEPNGQTQNAGAVFVFLGGPALFAQGTVTTDAADIVLRGTLAGELFGAAAAAADVTGDGVDDLVVGADQEGAASPNPGHVYVFAGPLTQNLEATAADVQLTGPSDDSGFGLKVVVGEVTGDAEADLVVAAMGANGGTGEVHVFAGGTSLATGASADVVFGGPLGQGSPQFGQEIQVGDLDDDGTGDVIVGATRAEQVGVGPTGAVFVFLGGGASRNRPDAILQGEGRSSELGFLGPPQDVNGDGTVDLVAFAPFLDDGVAYVVFGASGLAGTLTPGVRIVAEQNEYVGFPDFD